jgi:putative heme-binding domain-containing protein
VLDNRYLARNPFLAAPATVHEVAASGEKSHVFPRTSAWTTSNLHAGQFTAACGVEIYRGDALGGGYYGNAFTCEPTGSLVHREVLARAGATFESRPASEGREFLTSDDPWFRPVNLETGPDGALYIVDMYRAVIEHPQYMPSELQQRPDLRLGDDRGRIYRIVRADAKKLAPAAPRLSNLPSIKLLDHLQHANAWWRETAARLLYERQDRSTRLVNAAAKIAVQGKTAASRAAALWVLAGLEALNEPTLLCTLDDADPIVRRQAIVLSEPRLANSSQLRNRLIELAADRDADVQFHAALALGTLEGPQVVEALARIGLERSDDRWTRLAVASSRGELAAQTARSIVSRAEVMAKPQHDPQIVLLTELATIVGSRRDAGEIGSLFSAVIESEYLCQASGKAVLLAVARGLERRGGSLPSVLARHDSLSDIKRALAEQFDKSSARAADDSLSPDERMLDIDLLRSAATDRAREILLAIVNTSPDQELRSRAAEALAGQAGGAIGRQLLEEFPQQTPSLRRQILAALVADAAGARLVLDAVASGSLSRHEIDAPREARLLKHADKSVQALAAKLLSREPPAERKAVLADYRSALALETDPLKGKELFRKHCAACHHIGDVGVDVAPDISDSRVKTADQLLVDILNPNQAIDNNYVSYTVVTRDGAVHTGIIASETPASITLKAQEAKSESLLRADIESITSSGLSLMPDGFERSLSKQDVADVISFVKNWRYLSERIPGVSPSP